MIYYNSLNDHYRKQYGDKVYKLALDAHFTCPNRDGTKDTRGCLFCSAKGSGDFTYSEYTSISRQIEAAKELVAKKCSSGKYIAYFQAFTNTYAPVEMLRRVYMEAVNHPDIVSLSIATRPDCLDADILALLAEIHAKKPVTIELGLQTIHKKTAELIRRHNTLQEFDTAVANLHRLTIPVVAHLIIGLPDETREMLLESIEHLNLVKIDGVKLQLLHVLKGTDLAAMYQNGDYMPLSMDEYVNLITDCIGHLSNNIVIHRLTGDAPRKLLLAPAWSMDKKRVLNAITGTLEKRGITQGCFHNKEEL